VASQSLKLLHFLPSCPVTASEIVLTKKLIQNQNQRTTINISCEVIYITRNTNSDEAHAVISRYAPLY